MRLLKHHCIRLTEIYPNSFASLKGVRPLQSPAVRSAKAGGVFSLRNTASMDYEVAHRHPLQPQYWFPSWPRCSLPLVEMVVDFCTGRGVVEVQCQGALMLNRGICPLDSGKERGNEVEDSTLEDFIL